MMRYSILVSGCLLFLAAFSVSGEQAGLVPQVFHDPFAKPLLRKPSPSRDTGKSESAAWAPALTSTLRAGKNSMVIVAGRVVKLGEKIEGYKLIDVDERSAVFLKKRQRIRITLDE